MKHMAYICLIAALMTACHKTPERSSNTRHHTQGRHAKTNVVTTQMAPPVITDMRHDNTGVVHATNIADFVAALNRTYVAETSALRHVENDLIERLTPEGAQVLFEEFAGRRGQIAPDIAMKCKDYEAGTVFFSNYYAVHHDDPDAAGVAMLWGQFAVRHYMSEQAIAIYNDAYDRLETMRGASAEQKLQLLQRIYETENGMARFDHARDAARAYLQHVESLQSSLKPQAREFYLDYARQAYVRELCNLKQYKEAKEWLNATPAYSSGRGLMTRLAQGQYPAPEVLSIGLGELQR